MKHHTQRQMASALSALILISMILSLVMPLGGVGVYAQEATEEPPVEVPTEAATEAPVEPAPETTVLPPTEAPTEVPVEVTPDVVEPAPETAVPTPVVIEPIDPTPETVNPAIWGDDFNDGDTLGWTLSPGWVLGVEGENGFLTTSGQFETAVITSLMWEHLSISANVGIVDDNTANIAFRVGADNYNVTINASGRVSLYQGLTLLAEGPVVPVDPEAVSDTLPNWYAVTVTALGSQISVLVDDVFQINQIVTDPLPAGAVIFSTGANNTGAVIIDDVVVEQLPAPAVIITPEPTPEVVEPAPETAVPTPEVVEPTPEPEATPEIEVTPEIEGTEEAVEPTPEPEITVEPEVTVEPEITPEVTVEPELTPEIEGTEEAAPEATPEPEVTPEATVEPELTPEATPEMTPEPEVTPEATPEPGVDAEEESDLEAVIANDFEGEYGEWLFVGEASVIAGETNSAALLNAGSSLQPLESLVLADMRADFRVNLIELTQLAEGEVASPMQGLLLRFHENEASEAYVLGFSDTMVALYRADADGLTELTSVPAAHSLAAWYDLSLLVEGGAIQLDVNGETVLMFTDEAPILSGTFAFGASAGVSLLVDDVAVYDLSEDTAEPTIAPFSLDDVRGKLAGTFAQMIEAYLANDLAQMMAIATNFSVPVDEAGRFGMVVWPAQPEAMSAVGELILAGGGAIDTMNDENVAAYVPVESILELVSNDLVMAIVPMERIASTGPSAAPAPATIAGNIAPHTLGILGVNSWHEAGATGSGIEIAVIDTGFTGISNANANQSCVTNNPLTLGGQGNHGINVVETICDIAPNSTVFTYPALTAEEVVLAIDSARSAAHDLILLVVDTGISDADIDTAINNAYAAGIPVIASAGNGGTEGVKEFNYTGLAVSVTIETSPNSIIYYDTDQNNNFASEITGDFTNTNFGIGGGGFYNVPGNCTYPCDITLEFSSGGPNTTITVRVVDSTGQSSITGGTTPATGALTEVAANANVIAVGAVCFSDEEIGDVVEDRWQAWDGSARGNSGTGTPSVKPEVSAPTGINTSLLSGADSCEGGFTGTSASAAHVAGLSALALSNPNSNMSLYFSILRPQRLEHYLMTRTIDLFVDRETTGNADGYDTTFGSGLVQLGNPTFDLSFNWDRSWAVPGDAPGGAIYVSTSSLTLSPNGTIGAPYNHPARAIEAAGSNGTVVFLPGEYVSSFRVPAGVSIVSYDSVDEIDYPNSSIWVNEMMDVDGEAIGGVVVSGATSAGVTVQGFDFVGGSRLYEGYPGTNFGALPSSVNSHFTSYVRPIVITESGTSANRINIVNNTFSDFDYPLQILSSDNVWVDDNLFTGFTNVNTIAGTALHQSAAALDIGNSGVGGPDSERIVVLNNTFDGNITGQDNTGGNFAEHILGVRYAGVDLSANRFIDNSAAAIVFINQWPSGSPSNVNIPAVTSDVGPGDEVVIFSSIFDGNTDLETLIHLYQGRNFRFTNNTVVNHEFDITAFGDLITMGISTSKVYEVCGGDQSCNDADDHRIDIFNNLIYNNDMSGLIQIAAGNFQGTSFECRSVDDAALYSGAANNWYAANTGSAAGICNDGGASGNPAGGTALVVTNEWDVDPSTGATDIQPLTQGTGFDAVRDAFETAVFFTAINDPDDPFRLRPSGQLGEDPNPGIDAGDDDLVDGKILSDTSPLVDERAIDALGNPRFISLQQGTVGTFQNIDIGAYESGQPDPIILDENRTSSFTENEDTRISINLVDQVQDGFRPYTFTITEFPDFFDNTADSACGGAAITINEDGVATFCPAPNFYTDGTPLSFSFQAKGALLDDTVNGTIELNLNEVNDGSPSAYDDAENDGNDIEVIYADSLSSIDLRLRPYADLNAPTVSFSDEATDDVDYDWTFDNFSTVELSGDTFTSGQVNTAYNAAEGSGRLQLTPTPGEEGVLEFTYRVRDGDGNATATARRVRIIIVRQLAQAGIYDDTDLNLFYSAGWNPLYFAPVYNSTLHYSSNLDQTFEMSFVGNVFVLDYREYPGAGDFIVEVDHDDDGNFDNVLDGSLDGIICYGGQINGTLINANSDAAQDAAFGCSLENVESDTPLNKLRVTTASNSAFYLDAIEIRESAAIEAGPIVQESAFGLSYSGTWGSFVNSGNRGGAARYSSDPTATVTFNIDTTDANELVVYHYMHPIHGDLRICRTGTSFCLTKNLASDALSQNHAWVIPFSTLGLPENSVVQLTLNRQSGWINLDGLQVRPSIELGQIYQQDDPAVTTDGSGWATWINASTLGGTALYNNNTNHELSFTVDTTGAASLVLYHYKNVAQGMAEVCVAGTTTCQTRNFNDPALSFGNPWIIPLSSLGINSGQTERITVRPLNGFINVDALQLITATPAIEVGGIYGHNTLGITQSGIWTTWTNASTLDGSAIYSNVANASLSINVDTTDATDIVFYYYSNVAQGTAKVCGNNDNCVQLSYNTSDLIYRNAWIIPIDDLDLDADAIETITFERISGYVNFDGIQLRPEPLSAGNVYSQDNNAITKNGIWRTWVNASNEGGTAIYTNTPGAGYTFDLDTTGMEYLVLGTYQNIAQGVMEVCANDGANCRTYSLNNPALVFENKIYISRSDLSLAANTVETITVRHVSDYINLDSITTANTLPQISLEGGFYNQNSSELFYSGNWTTWSNEGNYNGDAVYSNLDGASMSFGFDATDVTDVVIYSYTNGAQGVLEICNGGTCEQKNLNSATLAFRQAWVISASDLNLPSSGSVILELSRISGFVNIDGVALRTAMTNGNTYEDDSTLLTPSGDWLTFVNAGHSGGSALYTSDQTASLSFTLDTTSVAYIILHHYAHPVHGLARFCQTGTANCTDVDLFADALTFGQSTAIPVGNLNLPANSIARVTMTPQGDFINVDAIELASSLPPTPVLEAGNLYEEDDPKITYTGTWTTWNNASTQGGTAVYTNEAGATATFQVDTTDMTNLVIYHYENVAQGDIQICRNSTDNCQSTNFNNGTLTFRNLWSVSKSDLGLGNDTVETITIRQVSGFVNISAIAVETSGTPELKANTFYQEDGYGIEYFNGFTWTGTTNTEFYGGSIRYATVPGAGFTFDMESGSAGFILYFVRSTLGANVEVCYKLKSDGTSTCSVVQETVDAFSADLQFRYGFAFPGLPDDAAYTVEVRHAGSNGEYMSFDGVAILGAPQSTLNGDTGRIDNTDPGILYSPEAWIDFPFESYYGGSQAYATDAGSIVQFKIEGNSFTVIERLLAAASGFVNMCVVENDNIEPDRLRCVSFSQQSATNVFQNPITFYGLGAGTHHIVLIHEDHGNLFFFDAIEIYGD